MTPLNTALRHVPIWLVYLLGTLPPLWFLYLGLTGGLGVEPINALERELGDLALQALVLGLAVTPLRRLVGLNLMKFRRAIGVLTFFRRAIGVLTFFYVLAHLLVWLVLDVQILSQIGADILKRPYITVGMGAFGLMLPLALTSNNMSVRKLGPRWRKLHRLVYPAALLGGVHNIMVSKTWQGDSLAWMAVILLLLAWRVADSLQKRRSRRG